MAQHRTKTRTRDRRVSRERPLRRQGSAAARSRHARPAPPPAPTAPASAPSAPSRTLVSRRKFLYGALGVGALGAAAAIGVGVSTFNASSSPQDDIAYLDAPKNALTTLGELEALESFEDYVKLTGTFDLPFGSLVWVSDDSYAACLLPTDTGSPLTHIGILNLVNGTLTTMLTKAIGANEGFEVYDVRATEEGIIWTEANILRGTWKVYLAPLTKGERGDVRLLEEGDATYETPTLAASGMHVFWQVIPRQTNESLPPARLMSARFDKEGTEVVYESPRGMGTVPYADNDSITIAAQLDSPGICYQLTNIDIETKAVRDTLAIPRSVVPLEAGYGKTGFMFSFPDIYEFDTAISNLGTYAPYAKPNDGNYSAARWFGFTRTPTAAPAWCDNLLIVKSTYAICGVDLDAGKYFAIDVENGADTYGEYLASTGTHDSFVTFTNITHTPIEGERIHACRVKKWTSL